MFYTIGEHLDFESRLHKLVYENGAQCAIQ